MSATLWVLIGLLAGPEAKLADAWCAGRADEDAELCAQYCGVRPVSEGCHLLIRFGQKGLMVGAVAKDKGQPVSMIAPTFGFSEADTEVLTILFDVMGMVPLPLTDAQRAQVAEGDAAFAEGRRADEQGAYLLGANAYGRAAAAYDAAFGSAHMKSAAARANQGDLLKQAGRHGDAQLLLTRAVVEAERLFGSSHSHLAAVLNNLAGLYYQIGSYEKAKPLYQRSLAIKEKALGPDHPEVAVTLNNLAGLYVQMGVYEKAEPLYQRSLAIEEKALGSHHPEAAVTLNSLAGLYTKMGAYTTAEPLYQRSLAIKEKALGSDHPQVAVTLNNLAGLYTKMGAYKTAEPLYQRSLAIAEKGLGSDHPSVAVSLSNLAGLYYQMGEYEKAEPIYQRSLAIAEKALGSDHPSVAVTLNNLAALYVSTSRHEKAESLYQRSLAIEEKALGPNHPEVAVTLNNLAVLYEKMGAYEKAEPLYQRDLAISEKALGPEHPSVAITLNGLAWLYGKMGAYEKAEPLYQRSLAIKEKTLGTNHPSVAITLAGLAWLYEKMGAYENAEPLYQRSLAIKEKALGPNHPEVAVALTGLAGLYEKTGAYEQARPLYQRSLAISEKVLGPDHSLIVATLNGLAGLYVSMGAYEKAEPLYQRSLAISENALGPDHSEVAVVFHNLGTLKYSQGEFEQAVSFLTRAAAVHETVFPAHHPNRGTTVETLGLLLLRLSRATEARPWIATAEQIGLTHFQAVVDTARTDAELMALHQRHSATFARAVGLYSAADGFEAALRWQGAALAAEMRWRDLRRIEHADRSQPGDSAGRSRVQAYREGSSARLRLLRTTPRSSEERTRLEAAQGATEEALKALGDAIAADHPRFAAHRALPEVSPAEVCAALHARGGVPLVDYVRHQVIDSETEGVEFKPGHLAFVVEPVDGGRCAYHRVDLGAAKRLDDAYHEWRETLDGAERCYGEKGQARGCAAALAAVDVAAAELRAVAWDPVAAHVGDRPRVMVVPDGPLASMPFGALPAVGGGYLAERHAFTMLSFPAAVTLLDEGGAAVGEGEAGALVVGDVNYERALVFERAKSNLRRCDAKGCAALDPARREAVERDRRRRLAERDRAGKLDPLAGGDCGPDKHDWQRLYSDDDPDRPKLTRLEGLAVDLAAALGVDTALVSGASATEEMVTSLARARRIIHFQTHGYAINERACALRHAVAQLEPGDDPVDALHDQAKTRYLWDPQRLAGLIFAGRNSIAETQSAALDEDILWRPDDAARAVDGLLRARDVLHLDLTGTLLVVLAACQSGLGMQVTGEGALGLGRAFLVAGARYAVVSQWQVPFKASSRMFTGFYRRVAEGVAPPLALQQAQVEAIAAWRAEGVEHSAFMWGAFVPLVGR